MCIQIVKPLSSITDILHVEEVLHSMYNTSQGATCQSLMTMEYQLWRKKVVQTFRSPRTESQCVLSARLSGVKLEYFENSCTISQLLPAVCTAKITRQLDCASVFKKQRTCHFPHQV